MEWWYLLVGVPAGSIALPFVLGPILIRFNTKQNAQPEFKLLDTESGELAPEVYNYFASTVEALKQDGFRLVHFMRMDDQTPMVKTCMALFVNEAQRDAAMVVAMYGEANNETSLQTLYVEFSTKFADESEVDTSNTAQLGSFPSRPAKKTHSIPEVEDPRRLYRIHRAVCERWGHGEKKPVPPHDQLPEHIARSMAKELEGLVGIGYFWMDEAGGCYRPTWKGACLMTWGQCWPVTAIRKANRARQNAALLLEIGEGGSER